MKPRTEVLQNGFALLIFLVVLMGIGGITLTGFSQQALKSVEAQRFEHNRKVLQEAKDALLMFAYNYPLATEANLGPGRLPCPDTDNDINGTIEFPPVCGSVGRLPWGDGRLNIPQLTGATGETLWYAVSAEFRNSAPAQVGANTNGNTVVNSDSVGTISIFDQSGGLRYAGATDGVAAIIIAPGAPIGRDENNDGVYEYIQVRGTDAEKEDPRNYLDTFGNFDNSDFENGSNAPADGFILGPVFDPNQNDIVINDQMIVITTDEIIAMSEKAVLQAYRDAIDDYLDNTGPNNYPNHYPWLFDYNLDDLGDYPGEATSTASVYNSSGLTNKGRIPTVYSEYFTEESIEPIATEITIKVSRELEFTADNDIPTIPLPVLTLEYTTEVPSNIVFTGDGAIEEKPDGTDTDDYDEKRLYYTETILKSRNWIPCDNDADTLSDCNRDSYGDFTEGDNEYTTRVWWVGIELELDYPLNLEYPVGGVELSYPADSGTHHEVRATFPADDIGGDIGLEISFQLGKYESDEDELDDARSENLEWEDDASDLWDRLADINSTGTVTIGLRYYPELPKWVLDNSWYDSIMMAYADAYRPDSNIADCIAGSLTNPCLTVLNTGGANNAYKSLLVIAGQHDWIDTGNVGLGDDVIPVFEVENANLDNIFDVRVAGGNDKILVIDRLP
ncbi:MAG: hypothetical protein GY820_44475 [Gammaproteobacteria bacterium]|nr:hypothetical protein [Gammaproteobacteria bacterium]